MKYVPPTEPGDVNRDGKVDAADLATAAAAFNSRPGMPNWNPAADLNHDVIVNIFDLVVGRNFAGVEGRELEGRIIMGQVLEGIIKNSSQYKLFLVQGLLMQTSAEFRMGSIVPLSAHSSWIEY